MYLEVEPSLFCVPTHTVSGGLPVTVDSGATKPMARNNGDDVGSFDEVVSAADRTVLFWTPWHCPAALGRVWCLYEILATTRVGKPLEVALAPSDLQRLTAASAERLGLVLDLCRSLEAAATFAGDWKRIHDQIEEQLGDRLGAQTQSLFHTPGFDPVRGRGDFRAAAQYVPGLGLTAGHTQLDAIVHGALREALQALGISTAPERSSYEQIAMPSHERDRLHCPPNGTPAALLAPLSGHRADLESQILVAALGTGIAVFEMASSTAAASGNVAADAGVGAPLAEALEPPQPRQAMRVQQAAHRDAVVALCTLEARGQTIVCTGSMDGAVLLWWLQPDGEWSPHAALKALDVAGVPSAGADEDALDACPGPMLPAGPIGPPVGPMGPPIGSPIVPTGPPIGPTAPPAAAPAESMGPEPVGHVRPAAPAGPVGPEIMATPMPRTQPTPVEFYPFLSTSPGVTCMAVLQCGTLVAGVTAGLVGDGEVCWWGAEQLVATETADRTRGAAAADDGDTARGAGLPTFFAAPTAPASAAGAGPGTGVVSCLLALPWGGFVAGHVTGQVTVWSSGGSRCHFLYKLVDAAASTLPCWGGAAQPTDAAPLPAKRRAITSLALFADEGFLCCAMSDGFVGIGAFGPGSAPCGPPDPDVLENAAASELLRRRWPLLFEAHSSAARAIAALPVPPQLAGLTAAGAGHRMLLMTAGDDATVRIWDVTGARAALLLALLPHPTAICAALPAGGWRAGGVLPVLTLTEEAEIRLWSTRPLASLI